MVADLQLRTKMESSQTFEGLAGSMVTSILQVLLTCTMRWNISCRLSDLNPERPSPISTNHADNRSRPNDWYARQNMELEVPQIGTFGTMMAKGSIQM